MPQALEILIYTLGLPITGEDPTKVSLGGSETAVVSMATALARAGNRLTVACNTEQTGPHAGVEYVPVAGAVRHLSRRRCDLFLSCRHHEILDQPVRANMVGLWNHDMPGADFARRYARGLSKSSFSFFLSQFHLQQFEQVVPGISGHGVLTSNGVDFDAMQEAVGEREPEELLFLYGSRPERGLDFLLRFIWPRVRALYPEAHLLVSSYDVGTLTLSPEIRKYYQYCRELTTKTAGVVDMGDLTRREFWEELARCTAVLYPTNSPEISCMVALEAQAAGVPVVTSDAFALCETVGCEETRVREPWGTPEYVDAFVEKVRLLVEDPAFLNHARAVGRRHVTPESHSWDALAQNWARFFHDTFEKRFQRNRAGVLRRLLARDDLAAAERLAGSVPEDDDVFDPWDLEELRRRIEGSVELQEPDRTEEASDVDEQILRTPPLPKISATILVKNEEANLRRAIESFEDIADEIIVGDTGSTDLTVEVGESMGFQGALPAEGNPGGPVRSRRWVDVDFQDFAQARNDLAAHATGDYIYWQDADEILIGAEDLRRWIDDNVFFDAFALEQRHLHLDRPPSANHPIRCFRPRTADGPLKWVGCIHEVVEHGVKTPATRIAVLPEIHVAHLGYLHREVCEEKATTRNWDLLLKDRAENPDRRMGHALGLREYLSLAKYEIAETGDLTAKAHRCLNLGFEVWWRTVRHFPESHRHLGFDLAQEILRILAQFDSRLWRTGQVPIEVEFSFAARRGALDIRDEEVPKIRQLFASVDELREEFRQRLDGLEAQLVGFERPPETLPEGSERHAHLELPPALFGIEPEEE